VNEQEPGGGIQLRLPLNRGGIDYQQPRGRAGQQMAAAEIRVLGDHDPTVLVGQGRDLLIGVLFPLGRSYVGRNFGLVFMAPGGDAVPA